MNITLTDIIQEFNPLHDFKEVDFTKLEFDDCSSEADNDRILFLILALLKPTLRGTLYGTLAGYLMAAFTDIPREDCMRFCIEAGVVADLFQYATRTAIYGLRSKDGN